MFSLSINVPRLWPRRSRKTQSTSELVPLSFQTAEALRAQQRSHTIEIRRAPIRRKPVAAGPIISYGYGSEEADIIEVEPGARYESPLPIKPLRSPYPMTRQTQVTPKYNQVEVKPARVIEVTPGNAAAPMGILTPEPIPIAEHIGTCTIVPGAVPVTLPYTPETVSAATCTPCPGRPPAHGPCCSHACSPVPSREEYVQVRKPSHNRSRSEPRLVLTRRRSSAGRGRNTFVSYSPARRIIVQEIPPLRPHSESRSHHRRHSYHSEAAARTNRRHSYHSESSRSAHLHTHTCTHSRSRADGADTVHVCRHSHSHTRRRHSHSRPRSGPATPPTMPPEQQDPQDAARPRSGPAPPTMPPEQHQGQGQDAQDAARPRSRRASRSPHVSRTPSPRSVHGDASPKPCSSPASSFEATAAKETKPRPRSTTRQPPPTCVFSPDAAAATTPRGGGLSSVCESPTTSRPPAAPGNAQPKPPARDTASAPSGEPATRPHTTRTVTTTTTTYRYRQPYVEDAEDSSDDKASTRSWVRTPQTQAARARERAEAHRRAASEPVLSTPPLAPSAFPTPDPAAQQPNPTSRAHSRSRDAPLDHAQTDAAAAAAATPDPSHEPRHRSRSAARSARSTSRARPASRAGSASSSHIRTSEVVRASSSADDDTLGRPTYPKRTDSLSSHKPTAPKHQPRPSASKPSSESEPDAKTKTLCSKDSQRKKPSRMNRDRSSSSSSSSSSFSSSSYNPTPSSSSSSSSCSSSSSSSNAMLTPSSTGKLTARFRERFSVQFDPASVRAATPSSSAPSPSGTASGSRTRNARGLRRGVLKVAGLR